MQVKVKAAQMTKYGFCSRNIQPKTMAVATVEKRKILPIKKDNGAKRIMKKRVVSIKQKIGKSIFLSFGIFLCFGTFLAVNEVHNALF